MDIWCWLSSNSATVQAMAAALSVVLAAVTIIVLFVTWRSVKDQATAARALTDVAKEQKQAAVDAAESARKQSELLSSQIEQSIAPLLVAEPDDRPEWKNCKLVNRGPGVAFKIFYWRGGFELKNTNGLPINPVQPSTLGPGNFVYLPIPPAWDVFTVAYKGVDRQWRWTIVYRDPAKPQEHVVSKGLQEFYLS